MYEKFKKIASFGFDGFIFFLNFFIFWVLYGIFSRGWKYVFKGYPRIAIFKDSAPTWGFVLLFFFFLFLFSFSFVKSCIAYRQKQRKPFILWGMFSFIFYMVFGYKLIDFITSLR